MLTNIQKKIVKTVLKNFLPGHEVSVNEVYGRLPNDVQVIGKKDIESYMKLLMSDRLLFSTRQRAISRPGNKSPAFFYRIVDEPMALARLRLELRND